MNDKADKLAVRRFCEMAWEIGRTTLRVAVLSPRYLV